MKLFDKFTIPKKEKAELQETTAKTLNELKKEKKIKDEDSVKPVRLGEISKTPQSLRNSLLKMEEELTPDYSQINVLLPHDEKVHQLLSKKFRQSYPGTDEKVLTDVSPSKRRGRPAGSKNTLRKVKKGKQERRRYQKQDLSTDQVLDKLKLAEEKLFGSKDKNSFNNEKKSKVPVHAFKPGNSFGKGRAVGSKSNAQLALETVCYDNADALLKRMVELGKEGDMVAARFVLERILPAARVSTRINLPLLKLADMKAVDESLNLIIGAMSIGEISLEEAENATKVIEMKIKSFIHLSMEERVANLEKVWEERMLQGRLE